MQPHTVKSRFQSVPRQNLRGDIHTATLRAGQLHDAGFCIRHSHHGHTTYPFQCNTLQRQGLPYDSAQWHRQEHAHIPVDTTIPGCDLMNDDNPIIRIVDGKPVVYGSPWSGKTPCYRNIEAPVGGIVSIKQHSENIIRRLSPVEAFTILLPACSSMKWDARIYNGICDSITKFIQTCKIWELQCLPNNEAAILCHDTICKESHS